MSGDVRCFGYEKPLGEASTYKFKLPDNKRLLSSTGQVLRSFITPFIEGHEYNEHYRSIAYEIRLIAQDAIDAGIKVHPKPMRDNMWPAFPLLAASIPPEDESISIIWLVVKKYLFDERRKEIIMFKRELKKEQKGEVQDPIRATIDFNHFKPLVEDYQNCREGVDHGYSFENLYSSIYRMREDQMVESGELYRVKMPLRFAFERGKRKPGVDIREVVHRVFEECGPNHASSEPDDLLEELQGVLIDSNVIIPARDRLNYGAADIPIRANLMAWRKEEVARLRIKKVPGLKCQLVTDYLNLKDSGTTIQDIEAKLLAPDLPDDDDID